MGLKNTFLPLKNAFYVIFFDQKVSFFSKNVKKSYFSNFAIENVILFAHLKTEQKVFPKSLFKKF